MEAKDIDWSMAPKGATHYGLKCDLFYKVQDEKLFMKSSLSSTWYLSNADLKYLLNEDYFSARPTEWDGQGVPPVGAVCEYIGGDGFAMPGEISCHIMLSDVTVSALIQYPRGGYDIGTSDQFRPIKLERDKAIDEMTDVYHSTNKFGKSFCEGLYDAGRRKK